MPKNYLVENVKSKNELVVDLKPRMQNLGLEINQLYSRNLFGGMPMGLLLSLTYPTNIIVTTPMQ